MTVDEMDARDPRDASWRSERDESVWAPYGMAALAATEWLDETPRALAGVPGRWHAAGGAVVGDPDGTALVLAPGQSTRRGELELRAFARDGAVALRVLDPAASQRRGISQIVRYPFDAAARTTGTFVPHPRSAATLAVDGHAAATTYDGVVRFEWGGKLLELTVEDDDGELFAAFADATGGDESYRFRFLRLAAPAPDGRVEVDLNRAHLPPCAFSDHYVCVLPPAGNRWDVPVRAGERQVV